MGVKVTSHFYIHYTTHLLHVCNADMHIDTERWS